MESDSDHWLEASVTYRAIFEKGVALGIRKAFLHGLRMEVLVCGAGKFGLPDEATRSSLTAVNDLDRLKGLTVRVTHANGRDDLLAGL